MHPILQRMEIGYRIFVVEQNDTAPFNKAKIMNAAFLEASTRRFAGELEEGVEVKDQQQQQVKFTCFVFHDVDLLLQNELNDYGCRSSPRYMCPAIDIWGYTSFSAYSFGGVVGITGKDFRAVNGYSNRYWGWGSEDDDLFWRYHHAGYKISRPSMAEGRYTMLKHKPSARNGKAIELLTKTEKGRSDSRQDGLSNINYELLKIKELKLFTKIIVNAKMTSEEEKLTDAKHSF